MHLIEAAIMEVLRLRPPALEHEVKSICSNFVVISNDDKITVNHFVVILSSFQI